MQIRLAGGGSADDLLRHEFCDQLLTSSNVLQRSPAYGAAALLITPKQIYGSPYSW